MKLALTKELFPRQEADTLFGNIEREFGPLLDFEILLKIFHDFGTNQLESIDGEISKEQISSLMNENEVLLAVLRKRRNPLGQKYRRWVRPYIDVLRELIRIRSSEEERNFLRKSFHQILQEKGWGDFFPIVDYETQAGYKDLIDRYMSSRLPSRLETYEQKFNLKLIEYSPEGKQAGQIIDKIMCLISQELDVHNVRPRYDWVIRIVNHLHLPYFHSFFYGKTQALSLNKKTIEYVKKRIQRVRT
ncbi:MAG: hypothetical protein HY033_01255 [Ignavibacteriae bacterium]|nr:hypothetical protein [Ignavibacteriota bacterium]